MDHKEIVLSYNSYEPKHWILCPYDVSHEVLNTKMTNHLIKCRRNYVKKVKAEGDSLLMLTCKYNMDHHCPAPEIIYHESQCPDRTNIIQHAVQYINRATGETRMHMHLSCGNRNIFNPYLAAAKPTATVEVNLRSSYYESLLPCPSELRAKAKEAAQEAKKTQSTIRRRSTSPSDLSQEKQE